MDSKNIKNALKSARMNRTSWRGDGGFKGFAKTRAHRAERRLSKALSRESV